MAPQSEAVPAASRRQHLPRHAADVVRMLCSAIRLRRLAAGEDLVVVDLRHRAEFALYPHTVPGAFHLLVEELAARRGEIPGGREVVLLCT